MKLNFTQVLFLVLLVLKVAKFVEWSWWVVLSPLAVGMFAAVLLALIEELKKGGRK